MKKILDILKKAKSVALDILKQIGRAIGNFIINIVLPYVTWMIGVSYVAFWLSFPIGGAVALIAGAFNFNIGLFDLWLIGLGTGALIGAVKNAPKVNFKKGSETF